MNRQLVFSVLLIFLLSSCNEEKDVPNLEPITEFNDSLFERCPESIDTTKNNYHIYNTSSPGEKWWVLSRQYGSCAGERGIFLFNETTSEIEIKIDLPNELSSPHGLTYKNGSLWLVGLGRMADAYQIDPNTGEIIRIWENISGSGIALRGDTIFVAGRGYIDLISQSDESKINTFNVNSNTIEDLTVVGDDIFYVVNGEIDPILKLSMNTQIIDTVALTGISTISTIAFKEDRFYVMSGETIYQYDSAVQETSGIGTLDINGWVTSFSPF